MQQPLSDTVLVGLISAAGLLLANLVIGWVQLRKISSQNRVDDASVATAYANLNQELRSQIEKMEERIQHLEQAKTGPYRVTTDIAVDPEPRIIRSEVVLMSAEPVVTGGGKG